MKQACKSALRVYMMRRFRKTRFDQNLSRDKFSEILMMDPRSYYDLETGISCCSALTLVLYLVFCCDDVQGFIDDMKALIENAINSVENAV